MEDIYFIINMNILYLDYNKLIESFETVIKYAMKESDTFSLITNQKKPYLNNPPITQHDLFINKFSDYLVKTILNVKEWEGTKTRENHKVMLVYNSNNKIIRSLDDKCNFFDCISLGLPEDICFYRSDNPWFATISHEKIAYLINPKKEDISLFEKYQIKK